MEWTGKERQEGKDRRRKGRRKADRLSTVRVLVPLSDRREKVKKSVKRGEILAALKDIIRILRISPEELFLKKDVLSSLKKIIEKHHVSPEELFPQLSDGRGPEPPDLDELLFEQTGKLIELDFHKELGLDKKHFLETTPSPFFKKKLFDLGFDKLVLVDARIPFKRQLKLTRADCSLTPKMVEEIEKRERELTGIRLARPYWIQVQDGRRNLGKSAHRCFPELSSLNERGLTLLEGISLAIQYPEVLRRHQILLGTPFGGLVPCLSLGPALTTVSVDFEAGRCGLATVSFRRQ